MEKYVPFEKMSKKEQKKINAARRSESFGMSMVTKIDTNRIKYNRTAEKRKAIKEEW